MLLIIQILLFASFLALRARPFDQDIDLNQPASPAEESPTEIMIPTDQRTTSASETAHTQAKSKTEDQILLKNARQKKWYHKIKTQPEKYKAFLKNKADNRRMQYKNIDQSKKKELRATKRKVQAAYKERKLEKDPNFKPYDRRKELRKRVREGNATVEDLQQYEELKARHAAGQRVSAKRRKEKKKLEQKDP